jgi:glycosyltransferase involved in cell wall biosynthesis
MPIYPKGRHPYGSDVVGMHARHFGADWVITLMDQWALGHETLQDLNVALWMPVDCDPLGGFDSAALIAKRDVCRKLLPIALTEFGRSRMQEAGFAAEYVPHGVESRIFKPPDDRKALREAMRLDDKFVIFMNAANLDKARKAFPEQFAAFSRFANRHPDALLVLHTQDETPQGLNLPDMAQRMAISEDQIKFNSQYLIAAGLISPEQLRGSYGMADLYSGCSLAEGFGLPLVEAQMCGLPVVTTDGPEMKEVAPHAWYAKSEKAWAAGHNAWWWRPTLDSITKLYELAYARDGRWHAKRAKGREAAMRYDADTVWSQHWLPVLKKMEEML